MFDAKRLIGRKFDDSIVQKDMKLWPFKVVKDGSGLPQIEVKFKGETKKYYPAEISSQVLMKLKQQVDTYAKKSISNCVITVPAYFTDA